METLISACVLCSSSARFGTQFFTAGATGVGAEGAGAGTAASSVPTTVCWPDARKIPPPTGRAARGYFAAAKCAIFRASIGVIEVVVGVVDGEATAGVSTDVGVVAEAEGAESDGMGAITDGAGSPGLVEGADFVD
jgi:hypothetical protein